VVVLEGGQAIEAAMIGGDSMVGASSVLDGIGYFSAHGHRSTRRERRNARRFAFQGDR
jgi:hypothetical protein